MTDLRGWKCLHFVAVWLVALMAFTGLVTAQAPTATPAARPLPPGISIQASVEPEAPIAGDVLIYRVAVNGNVEPQQFNFPEWNQLKGVQLMEGPTRNYLFLNGATSQSLEFRLQVNDPGAVTIPPTQIRINGYWYSTNAISLTVRDVPQDGSSVEGLISARSSNPSVNREIRNGYFARTEVPSQVFQGQAVPVTIYVYRDPKLVSFARWEMPQEPSGSDFLFPTPQRSANNPQSVSWEKVTLGGRAFERVPLHTFYAVPTKTGKLRLTPPAIRIYFQTRRSGRPDIDAMFGMSIPGFDLVDAELPMRSMELTVNPIPAKPADATAQVVGEVVPKLEVDRDQLARRELLTVKLTLTGEAYLELLTPPSLGKLPGLTAIDSKTNSGMVVDRQKLISQKQFEYVFQATEEGEATIPALAFALVNPSTGEQKVVRTEAVPIRIRPANADTVQVGGGSTVTTAGEPEKKEEARVLGQDVAYIDASPLTQASTIQRRPFYLHPVFWALQLLPVGAALAWGARAIRARRSGQESASARLSRGRRAAQNAVREARRQVTTANRNDFYATLTNGVLEYVASLLGRSARGLTMEEAVAALEADGRDSAACGRLLEVFRAADAVRYSPAPDTPESREKAITEAESVLAALDRKERGA